MRQIEDAKYAGFGVDTQTWNQWADGNTKEKADIPLVATSGTTTFPAREPHDKETVSSLPGYFALAPCIPSPPFFESCRAMYTRCLHPVPPLSVPVQPCHRHPPPADARPRHLAKDSPSPDRYLILARPYLYPLASQIVP